MKSSFEYRNHVCIVLEELSLDLYEILKHRKYRGLPLPLIQNVLKEMLSALVVLERARIVHSDIKPENILLSDIFSQSVKLIDFGSARFLESPPHFYVQSRYYRAPEVVLAIPHDTKIDMWSLGCVAAELFLGFPLFPGQNEIHLLELITGMLGQFPLQIFHKTPRKNLFHSNGHLKSEEEINGSKVDFPNYFTYSSLDQTILEYRIGLGMTPEAMTIEKRRRLLFVDLLKKMLNYIPEERISPSQALEEPFLQYDFSK